MPKVSIVLPVYNGERYLEEAIQSVLDQTFKDWELIIIDDCSSDKTPEIIREFVQKDLRIKSYRNIQNQKLPRSLNIGFEKAQGEYFSWTSCDNLYKPEAITQLISSIVQDKEVGLVYSSFDLIDECGKYKSTIKSGKAEDIGIRNVVGACFLYRAEIAKKIGGYDPDLYLAEDYEYWLRIASVAKLGLISESLYLYRQHSESLSSRNEKKIIEIGIKVQKKYFDKLIKTRKKAAEFYAYLRARDIYNPLRQFYLFVILLYSPSVFIKEIKGLIFRRFK